MAKSKKDPRDNPKNYNVCTLNDEEYYWRDLILVLVINTSIMHYTYVHKDHKDKLPDHMKFVQDNVDIKVTRATQDILNA